MYGYTGQWQSIPVIPSESSMVASRAPRLSAGDDLPQTTVSQPGWRLILCDLLILMVASRGTTFLWPKLCSYTMHVYRLWPMQAASSIPAAGAMQCHVVKWTLAMRPQNRWRCKAAVTQLHATLASHTSLPEPPPLLSWDGHWQPHSPLSSQISPCFAHRSPPTSRLQRWFSPQVKVNSGFQRWFSPQIKVSSGLLQASLRTCAR